MDMRDVIAEAADELGGRVGASHRRDGAGQFGGSSVPWRP
jgi:hypothetical protein